MSKTLKPNLRRLLLGVALLAPVSLHPSISHASNAAPQLAVSGNQLVVKGTTTPPYVLHGVDRYGPEYMCLNGDGQGHYGIFDGPAPTDQEYKTMAQWGINAVRFPLNEDCWLGINYTSQNQQYFGQPYRAAIQQAVTTAIQNGITPILDLHNTAPGSLPATGLEMMPDYDHSIAFWQSVDSYFGGNDAVIFDAFNEPNPPDWLCWKDGMNNEPGNSCYNQGQGCPTRETSPVGTGWYNCVGMQALADAIRLSPPAPPATVSDNIMILGGLNYSKEFNNWGNSLPIDHNNPGHPYSNLAMSGHTYGSSPGFNVNPPTPPFWPETSYQWDQNSISQWLPYYPMVAGEIGEYDLKGYYIDSVMQFLDSPGGTPPHAIPPQSYFAWHWNPNPNDNADLITDWSTLSPTCYGLFYQTWLLTHNYPSCVN